MAEESNTPDSPEASPASPSPSALEILGGTLVISFAVFVLLVSEVGVFVAPLVVIGGGLIIVGARRRRKLVIALGVLLLSSPVIAYVAALWLLFSWALRQEPIPQQEWPYTLSIVASDTATPDRQVEAVDMGGFIDTQNVWRLPVEPRELPQVARDLAAKEIPESRVPRDFWGAFPRGMKPSRSPRNRYFMSEGFPVDERGGDGDHHLAMYDAAERRLYVWEISNF